MDKQKKSTQQKQQQQQPGTSSSQQASQRETQQPNTPSQTPRSNSPFQSYQDEQHPTPESPQQQQQDSKRKLYSSVVANTSKPSSSQPSQREQPPTPESSQQKQDWTPKSTRSKFSSQRETQQPNKSSKWSLRKPGLKPLKIKHHQSFESLQQKQHLTPKSAPSELSFQRETQQHNKQSKGFSKNPSLPPLKIKHHQSLESLQQKKDSGPKSAPADIKESSYSTDAGNTSNRVQTVDAPDSPYQTGKGIVRSSQPSQTEQPPTPESSKLKQDSTPKSAPAGSQKFFYAEAGNNTSELVQEATSSPQKQAPAGQGMELAIRRSSKEDTTSRPILIETSHLLLTFKKFQTIIKYIVAINPDNPKRLLRTVMEECRLNEYPGHYPAYDGQQILYSYSNLPFGNRLNREITIMENGRKRSFQVSINETAKIDLNLIQEYCTSTGDDETNLPHNAIQCLDVVFRNALLLRCIPVDRLFFTQSDKPIDLGEGIDMYHGFFQSVILGQQPFLNVDVVHKAFPKSIAIVQLISELNKTTNRLKDENFTKLNTFLKNLKVCYQIPNNSTSKRIYRINQLDKPARYARFTNNNGEETTVKEYYSKIKGYKLKFINLPCLWVGSKEKKILLPAELCTLLVGQVLNKYKMTSSQESEMIKQASTSCLQRKEKILTSVAAANFNTDNYISAFGITVSDELIKIKARVLNSPKLLYSSNEIVKPLKGVWQASKFKDGKSLTRWAILGVDDIIITKEQLQLFEKKMIEQGGMVGMTIKSSTISFIANDWKSLSYRKKQEKLINEFKKIEGIQLVVVVIPKDTSTYKCVKQVAELRTGILTQCVLGSNLVKLNKIEPIVANMLLKINAKLNGVNYSLHTGPLSFKKLCMIMGADVTHPSGDNKETTPSIAAVTASHDLNAFQYNISWRLQPPTQEIISDLAEIVKEHLLFFKKKHGANPEHIIFFRDGVSESQFNEVLEKEVQAIRQATSMIQADGLYKPEITFLVVQKRHHTRFFTLNPEDSEDINRNVPVGTIVDTDITHPTDVDFYLMSHASGRGTSRPTRYRKLYDDSNMGVDELEELTYHLCHMFTRCTRSVSYPAPTYYAHLAATRAKIYSESINIDINNLERSQSNIQIKENFIATMPMFFV